MRGVVFRIARPHRTGEGEAAFSKLVIHHRLIGEEALGIVERVSNKPRDASRSIPIRLRWTSGKPHRIEPIGAPVKRANHTVGVTRGELALPTGHPLSVEMLHVTRTTSLPVQN